MNFDTLGLSPRPDDLRRKIERRDRDRAQELDGDARQPEVRCVRSGALDRAGEEGGGRPAVLVLVAPRAARQLAGDQAAAVAREEGVHFAGE